MSARLGLFDSRRLTTLLGLATSRHLDTDDLKSLHAEATRVVGTVLRPFGTQLPMLSDRPSLDRLLRRGTPTVRSLADRRRAFDAGFDAHLTRPIAPDRLADLIEAGENR